MVTFFFRFGSFRLQKMATRKRSEPATAGFGVEPLGLARPCPEAKSARREGDRDSNLSGRHWEFMCSAACMQAARVARSALEFSCALLSGSPLFLRERDRFHIAGEMKTTCASPTIISIDVEEDVAAGTGIALSLNLGMGNCVFFPASMRKKQNGPMVIRAQARVRQRADGSESVEVIHRPEDLDGLLVEPCFMLATFEPVSLCWPASCSYVGAPRASFVTLADAIFGIYTIARDVTQDCWNESNTDRLTIVESVASRLPYLAVSQGTINMHGLFRQAWTTRLAPLIVSFMPELSRRAFCDSESECVFTLDAISMADRESYLMLRCRKCWCKGCAARIMSSRTGTTYVSAQAYAAFLREAAGFRFDREGADGALRVFGQSPFVSPAILNMFLSQSRCMLNCTPLDAGQLQTLRARLSHADAYTPGKSARAMLAQAVEQMEVCLQEWQTDVGDMAGSGSGSGSGSGHSLLDFRTAIIQYLRYCSKTIVDQLLVDVGARRLEHAFAVRRMDVRQPISTRVQQEEYLDFPRTRTQTSGTDTAVAATAVSDPDPALAPVYSAARTLTSDARADIGELRHAGERSEFWLDWIMATPCTGLSARPLAAMCAELFELLNRACSPRCPACSSPFVVDEGCTHVCCTMCGTHSCFMCGCPHIQRAVPSTTDELRTAVRRIGSDTRVVDLLASRALQSELVWILLESMSLQGPAVTCAEFDVEPDLAYQPVQDRTLHATLPQDSFVSCVLYPSALLKVDYLPNVCLFAPEHEGFRRRLTEQAGASENRGTFLLARITRMLHQFICRHKLLSEDRVNMALCTLLNYASLAAARAPGPLPAQFDAAGFLLGLVGADVDGEGGAIALVQGLRSTLQRYTSPSTQVSPGASDSVHRRAVEDDEGQSVLWFDRFDFASAAGIRGDIDATIPVDIAGDDIADA